MKNPTNALKRNTLISFFSLFTSFGTLICCALPALLVSLGLGATLVGLTSSFPQLIWISEHKFTVFGISFVLLVGSLIMQYHARNLPCPIDPNQARACTRSRIISKWITIFSFVVWAIGFSFAVLPYLSGTL